MSDLLQFPFMQRAFIGGIIIGILCGYYGSFIVQRKMSFLGSGLAHAAFGGVALGLLLNTEPLYTAVPFTVLIAAGIVFVRQRTTLSPDTSIGIFFSLAVALGIVFLSLKENYTVDAFTYLFGSILTVTTEDIIISSVILLISLLTTFKLWGRWAYAGFDREIAKTDKLKVDRDDYILNILVAITIVVSVKIVGIILVAAFLVIPSASSRLISKTFFAMSLLAVLFGVFSAFAGLIVSYQADLPSGASIILIQAAIFIFSLIISGKSQRNFIN